MTLDEASVVLVQRARAAALMRGDDLLLELEAQQDEAMRDLVLGGQQFLDRLVLAVAARHAICQRLGMPIERHLEALAVVLEQLMVTRAAVAARAKKLGWHPIRRPYGLRRFASRVAWFTRARLLARRRREH